MNTAGQWTRQNSTITLFDLDEREPQARAKMTSERESNGSGGDAMPVLRRGSRGSSVSMLQARLAAVGFNPGPIDGVFGSGTEAAVIAFQRARHLTIDGVVGPLTWAALGNRSSPARPTPAPTPAPVPASVAGRIVSEARKHLGFHEGPNNENPFSAYFGVLNVPWCAYFVSYVHTQAGIQLNIGSCDVLLDYVIERDRFLTANPRPGDIIIFDWTLGDHDPAEHVGIVESATSQTVTTIEGNSSDGVNRRDYSISSANIVGYGRLT